jgi:YidC/Oxa1 family membrane protein insertase
MMDRNSIIGLVLIFLILIGFAWYNQPSEAELQTLKHQQDSIALVNRSADSTIKVMAAKRVMQDSAKANTFDTAAAQQTYGTFASFSKGEESFTTLENEELKLTFVNKGGRIYSVELKKQKRFDKTPLILFTGDKNEFNYSFATADGKTIQTKDLYFTPVKADDGKSIAMQVKLADGQQIEQRYAFVADNNQMVDYKLNLAGMDKVIAPSNNHLALSWKQRIIPQEKNYDGEVRTTTAYYKYKEEEPNFISESKEEKIDLTTPVQWVSFKQQYFNASLLPDQPFPTGSVETKNDESKQSVKEISANLTIPYTHNSNETFGMKFYFGPNHYKSLAKLDVQLERIIPMGWGIFRWVNKYFVINVFYFLNQYIGNFGIIILLLTIIIKTLVLPMVYKSYLSAAKMRVLKPELDEIKEKFGDDMQKTQQENMKLYKKVGVNPLGGCIPMLLQLPILFAMFQFFPSAFELRQEAFLWADDLSTYDSIYTLPFSLPGYGNHVSLFTILMTISSLFYTHYNNQMTAVTGQMKWLSYMMPVIFMFVLNSYPAGLNYYYFLSNLATITQQLAIRRFVDDKAIHAQLQENKKKPVKTSKFQQKLEEMAKKRGVDLQNPKKK